MRRGHAYSGHAPGLRPAAAEISLKSLGWSPRGRSARRARGSHRRDRAAARAPRARRLAARRRCKHSHGTRANNRCCCQSGQPSVTDPVAPWPLCSRTMALYSNQHLFQSYFDGHSNGVARGSPRKLEDVRRPCRGFRQTSVASAAQHSLSRPIERRVETPAVVVAGHRRRYRGRSGVLEVESDLLKVGSLNSHWFTFSRT